MTHRLALVSGANQGIGYAIVKALASKQFRVLLGSRDLAKGQKAADDINKELKDDHQLVEAIQLDIDSDSSVRQAVETIRQRYKHLNVLVNNAGVARKGDAFDEEVARWTIQTNYYGLKRMLDAFEPILDKGARVVNVSSTSGQSALQKMSESLRSEFLRDDLTMEQLDGLMEQFIKDVADGSYAKQWPKSCYGVSKAGVTMLTRIYARDHSRDGITYNSCCPGYVSTNMSSYKGHLSIEQGARTPVHLALLPADDLTTGKFWKDEKIQPYC